MTVNYQSIRQINRCNKAPDDYFVKKYSLATMRACSHNCAYCDGRSEKYYVEGDFATDIVVRDNVADVLGTFLDKEREWGMVSFSSGTTDCYQHQEKVEEIMPSLLKVLLQKGYPASVMTKSNLPMRDIDLFDKLNREAGVLLEVSLTTIDDDIIKHFEPGAATASERIEMIKAFKERGIPVVVLAQPFLPGITDQEASIKALYSSLSDLNVDAVLPGSCTLRPGENKLHFYRQLEKFNPSLVPLYDRVYRENRSSGSPHKEYHDAFIKAYVRATRAFAIPEQIPHKIYKSTMTDYDSLYILLSHMRGLYRHHSSKERIDAAFKEYRKWLLFEKERFNRRRTLTYRDLEDKLRFMLEYGEMEQWISNPQLLQFMRAVVIEGKTFDYTKKKLLKV